MPTTKHDLEAVDEAIARRVHSDGDGSARFPLADTVVRQALAGIDGKQPPLNIAAVDNFGARRRSPGVFQDEAPNVSGG